MFAVLGAHLSELEQRSFAALLRLPAAERRTIAALLHLLHLERAELAIVLQLTDTEDEALAAFVDEEAAVAPAAPNAPPRDGGTRKNQARRMSD